MAPSPHRLLFLLVATIAAAAAALPAVVVAENNMPVADALVKLKKSFTNSSSLSSWLITDKDGDKHPCAPGSHEWYGVVCSGGKVLGLRLNGLGLGGTIDVDALASFPRLRSVSFAGNNFSGPLPAFHQLKALKSMYLSNNQFSGPLPEGFFANLSHLKKLWLDGNQLNGSIPASVAQASSLLELHLDRNDFTGELPPAPPPALKSFNVSENDLEGVVPEPFRRFDASMFAGNEYLCFVPTNVKSCKREQAVAVDSSHRRVVMVLAALLIVAVVALCACSSQPSSRDMEGLEEKPPAYMVKQASTQQPQQRSASWLGRRAGSSLGFGHRRSASAAKVDDLSIRSAGDLVMVNSSKGSFGLADLMKAAAENAKGGTDLVMWATSAMADGYESDLFDPAIMAVWKSALSDMKRLMKVAVDCVEADPEKRPDMKEIVARVEEVVATALARARESGSEDAASRSSHAVYVRDGSIQRMTSVGERSSRRGSSDYAYGIS
ncbi:putative inactive leucine-rich repeat receptor-like protein kinase [Panicum miliaceum]|uniref:Inactive leucine-rich repeat receptor-like protein kinase n=1 Tax=Panicum miliaceum TaxID=4540 RepID=A0A3L6PDT4_PANMI|nr:putative inactive leucine-rich repeat receptor-like protein kinase [Panicum miliaceum]